MERTRYFVDTESIDDGHTIELLSIGAVCEERTGRSAGGGRGGGEGED